MKILAIRIFNLASLEGLHTIDFTEEPLASSGIFAITGSTGAGKSTILDALCLALYNEAPRYESAKSNQVQIKDADGTFISQNDTRSILRDGTGEGYAEVDFIGVDEKKYRSKWYVSRARLKPAGRLQPCKMTLIDLENQHHLTETNTITLSKIAQLVGLDYNQFSKSVILAQGEFTAFLKADKDAKASLLEKLTGTEIYSEISKKIFEKYSEQKRKLEQLQDQANFIQLLSEDDIENFNTQLSEINIQTELKSSELVKVEVQLKAYTDLHQLEHKIQVQQQELSEKESLLLVAEERKQKVQKIESIQPIRHEILQLEKLKNNIASQKKRLEENQEESSVLLEKIHQCAVNKDSTLEEFNQHKKKYEEAKPLMETAKKLDVQIEEKSKSYSKVEQELKNVSEKYQDAEKSYSEKVVEQKKLNTEKEQVSQWLDSKKEKSSIVEHHKFILSKLENASIWNLQWNKNQNEIQTLEKSISDFNLNKESVSEKAKIYLFKKSQLESEINLVKEQFTSIDIDFNQKKSTEYRQQIKLLQQTLNQWNIYASGIELLQNLQSKNQNFTNQILEQKNRIEELKRLILKGQTERDILSNTFEKIKLETSDQVELLRSQLQQDEACPVCGSLEHPYAAQHIIDTSFSVMEKELKILEKNLQSQQHEEVKLSANIDQLEKQVAENLLEIKRLEKNTQNQLVEIQQTKIGVEISKIEDTRVSEYLQSEINQLEKEDQKLKELVEKYHHLNQQLNEWQNELKSNQNLLDEVMKNSNLLEIEMAKANESLQHSILSNQELDRQLLQVKEDLSIYFSNSGWMDNWKKQPVDFVQKIQDFVEEWKTKMEQFQKIGEGLLVAEKDLIHLEKNIEETTKQLKTLKSDLEIQKNDIELLKKNRSQLFGGEVISVVESKFQQTIQQSEQLLESYNKDFIQLEKDQTVLKTQFQQLQVDLSQNETDFSSSEQKINLWLNQHQIEYSLPEISQILDYSESWWAEEKKYLSDLDAQYQKAHHSLTFAQKNKEEHQSKFDWTTKEDVLQEEYQSIKTQIDQCKEETYRINNALEKDILEKKNKAAIIKDIEKQEAITLNWSRISQLIGASDGKKFKTYAQEYTLDILVNYANAHLRSLSNRYLLERIPDHLALQVIDMDMGEEVRTIYSLSGGETFLISLALALGLSSLSSRTLNVESIFIDEGFGTLDPQTLSMAMDALENLYQQGRKVGVISHVQEMTERIPVKIQVSKIQSGRSSIQIIGH